MTSDTTAALHVPRRETSYSIDGFRSLRDFHIDLKPGLNVLVGPNGSGKTNFIDFLDFLDRLVRNGVGAAVSGAGGISRVFSIENTKKSSPKITASYCGEATISARQARKDEDSVFRFDYKIEIRFSRNHTALYIASEDIRIKKLQRVGEAKQSDTLVGVLSISRNSPLDTVEPRWKVGRRLYVNSDRNPFGIVRNFSSLKSPDSLIQRLLSYPLAPDESILSIRGSIPAIDAIRQSITHGRSFNIIPDRAREPDDLAHPPIITRDGAGLSATLHAMQLARKQKLRSINSRISGVSSDSLDELIYWTSLVMSELEDISVVHDFHSGKYLGSLVIRGEKPIRIPLQATSDGTLKWLCLVCLIIAQGSTHSVEEPENFLHPRMQSYLVTLIRESINSRVSNEYFVLSTHSESLINNCEPEELIIFRYEGGRTLCHRVENPETVREEINNTGFGLGYYYASNAVS
ncbi:MAG: AAA family ATPase [Phenylobacterium sp.]|nr:AAA family ATPase [Phenylobacterium sp.]